MAVISPGKTAFLRFEIEKGDAGRKKSALQEIGRLYRRGEQFNSENRKSFETTINGMVLVEQDFKVVRWCLNVLARLGTKDGCNRYVVAALKQYDGDPEIVAAGIAALSHIHRGNFDDIAGLDHIDPSTRILAAMQTTDAAKLNLSGLKIDIDKTNKEVLKLALITIGLNRDIQNLLHPRHSNGTIVKQLGQYDDRIVKQYSVWCVMENKRLTLEDLGIPFSEINVQPPNVQAKLLQLGAERATDAKMRHHLINEGTFNDDPEARIGLAKGLTNAYYDGLEELTLNWYDTEQDKTVLALVAEHFARFSDVCGPYSDKARAIYDADHGLRDRILLGAEGRTLYGKLRAMSASNEMPDLFGQSANLNSMFQSAGEIKKGKTSVKVLFMAANPVNAKQLRLDKEARELKEQIALVKDAKIELEIEHAWATRTDQIQREILNSRPTVLHFSCHGDDGVLAFEDHVGTARPVTGEALADLISLCPSIKCVVLNACFSDSISAMIAAHVDAVIGCDAPINDDAAIFFSRAFYRALAHGEKVPVAFRLAKNELHLHNNTSEANKYKISLRSGP